jgi:hypothetical protein
MNVYESGKEGIKTRREKFNEQQSKHEGKVAHVQAVNTYVRWSYSSIYSSTKLLDGNECLGTCPPPSPIPSIYIQNVFSTHWMCP